MSERLCDGHWRLATRRWISTKEMERNMLLDSVWNTDEESFLSSEPRHTSKTNSFSITPTSLLVSYPCRLKHSTVTKLNTSIDFVFWWLQSLCKQGHLPKWIQTLMLLRLPTDTLHLHLTKWITIQITTRPEYPRLGCAFWDSWISGNMETTSCSAALYRSVKCLFDMRVWWRCLWLLSLGLWRVIHYIATSVSEKPAASNIKTKLLLCA